MNIAKFPEFSDLPLTDRDDYAKFIYQFDPISDIQFSTLHIWWNLNKQLRVSMLSDNLVIYYNQPFEEEDEGFCIVGVNNITSSVDTIMSFLASNSLRLRLIHVPEFTASLIDGSRYQVNEEHDFDEYVIKTKDLSDMEGKKYESFRRKLNSFQRQVNVNEISISELDIITESEKQKLTDFFHTSRTNNAKLNDPMNTEAVAFQKTLENFNELGLKCLIFEYKSVMIACVILSNLSDKKYYIGHHYIADYSLPYLSEFVHHEVAKYAVQNQIDYINIEMDLGIEKLKENKMKLKPFKKFRKFTVNPL